MRFLARIWIGFTQLIGLIIPFFAKATDFRNWGSGMRWAVRILVLVVVLVLLYIVNKVWFERAAILKGQGTFRQIWLPVMFLLFFALSWLGWWLWKLLTPDVQSSDFPDIDAAWDEARNALNRASIDLTEVPLFFILGRPAAPEEAMMQAAQISFTVKQTPRRGDAPLHVYANRDGLYVTCAGASLLGKQAAILAGEDEAPLASPDAGTPAVSISGNAIEEGKTLRPEDIAKTVGGKEGGAIQEVYAIMTRAREEGREPTPAEKKRMRILARKPRPSLMKVTEEVERLTARLTHLCRLIVRDRRPYCPVNGIMVLIPLAATDSDDDATQTGIICQQDIAAVRKAFQVNCPVLAMLCDMETAPGFPEFFDRFPDKQRHRRVGQRFPLVPNVEPDAMPGMIEGAVGWVCQALFPTWVYKFFRVEGQGKEATEATAIKNNSQLYRLMYEMRERQKFLARILTRALSPDQTGPLLFGGCYVGATGSDPAREQAFTAGVFRRMVDEQNFVSWTADAIQEENDFQRWAKIGYIAIGAFAVLVLVLVGFFMMRPS